MTMTITAEQADQRVDNFLIRELKGVPKSRIYRAIRGGEVRVNKKRVKAEYRLQPGDVLRIPPIRTAIKPAVSVDAGLTEALKARILYEDEGVLVLNKPAGLAVHGGSGLALGVIEAMRLMYPQANLELVHRLDKDTSGCLIIAKKRSVLKALHAALREQALHKKYLALVAGRWPKRINKIDAPLMKNILKSGERLVRVDEAGKASLTHFQVRDTYNDATLLSVNLLTGRTHQIRVHTAYAGHPIAGDVKYGNKVANQAFQKQGLKRLFLHAESVAIPDADGTLKTIVAPLDEPLQRFLQCLENARSN